MFKGAAVFPTPLGSPGCVPLVPPAKVPYQSTLKFPWFPHLKYLTKSTPDIPLVPPSRIANESYISNQTEKINKIISWVVRHVVVSKQPHNTRILRWIGTQVLDVQHIGDVG